MEKQIIKHKEEFKKLLEANGDETFKVVLDDDKWYEQLTVGETVYLYKFMTLKEVTTYNSFWKDSISHPVAKLYMEGKACAYVYVKKSVIYYYLIPDKDKEKKTANVKVIEHAELLAKMQSLRPPRFTRTVREGTSK